MGLGDGLVFVCTVNGVVITLPHRAGSLQYRCRSHDVLGIIKHSEVSAAFGLDGPSLPPPIPEAQTTIYSSTRYTSTTIYVQAAVRVCLLSVSRRERKEFDQDCEKVLCLLCLFQRLDPYNSFCPPLFHL